MGDFELQTAECRNVLVGEHELGYLRSLVLTWTTEAPTEPGWYWAKPAVGAADIVEVSRKGGAMSVVFYSAFSPPDNVYVDDIDCQWAGPIEPPEVGG